MMSSASYVTSWRWVSHESHLYLKTSCWNNQSLQLSPCVRHAREGWGQALHVYSLQIQSPASSAGGLDEAASVLGDKQRSTKPAWVLRQLRTVHKDHLICHLFPAWSIPGWCGKSLVAAKQTVPLRTAQAWSRDTISKCSPCMNTLPASKKWTLKGLG